MKKGKWLIYFVLILAVAVMTIPFLWMLLTSFKTFEDSTKIPLQILPEQWILTNYTEILESVSYSKMVYEFYFSGCYFTARTGVSGLARCVCICKTSFSGKKIFCLC